MFTKHKKELELAEAKYRELEKCTEKLLPDTIKKSVRTEITNGYKYNVAPFQNERYGFKTNGKIIAKEIIKNGCIKYYFDEQDRVILEEEISEFLEQFHNRVIYLYEENYLSAISLDGTQLTNVTIYNIDNNKFINSATYTEDYSSIDIYKYENNVLEEIAVYHKKHDSSELLSLIEHFHYDKKNTLECIQKNYSNDYTKTVYSTQKINYKKLTERLETELASSVKDFLDSYDDDDVTVIGFTCQPAHNCFDISIHTDEFEEYLSPADFTYEEVCSLELVDHPLGDEEEEKVVMASINAINNFTSSEVFKSIPKAEDFCATIFYYDLEYYEQENDYARKILKNNPYFNCEKDEE